MNIPPNKDARSVLKGGQTLLDPQLAAYELLRRMICNRSPFDPLEPEESSIPDEFKGDVESGTRTYQVSLYLEAVKAKLGPPISDNWTDYRQFADYGGAADGRWRPGNWTHYQEFADLMNRFRDFYNLRSFTFKAIDKFLFLSGEELRKSDPRS